MCNWPNCIQIWVQQCVCVCVYACAHVCMHVCICACVWVGEMYVWWGGIVSRIISDCECIPPTHPSYLCSVFLSDCLSRTSIACWTHRTIWATPTYHSLHSWPVQMATASASDPQVLAKHQPRTSSHESWLRHLTFIVYHLPAQNDAQKSSADLQVQNRQSHHQWNAPGSLASHQPRTSSHEFTAPDLQSL